MSLVPRENALSLPKGGSMKTVKQLLDEKGTNVFAVAPTQSVYEVVEEMARRGVGALLVMEGAKLVGIVSERDCARKVILQDKPLRETPVRDIMSARVVVVAPTFTVSECMALMTDKRVRHLPILEGDRVLGVISIGDVVRAVISDQRFMIDQLERYITS